MNELVEPTCTHISATLEGNMDVIEISSDSSVGGEGTSQGKAGSHCWLPLALRPPPYLHAPSHTDSSAAASEAVPDEG